MKQFIKSIFILLFAAMSQHVNAQLNADNMPKKWGIETELIQPFLPNVGIVRIVATRTVYAPANDFKGDLLIGAYIRPNVKHDVVEKINEYMLILGYRQYFWKGLHAEVRSNMGYAWGTKNLIDGKDYNNPTWFWEANAGYKFDFAKKQNTNLYAIAQFGILSSISSNIGPRGGKSDTFPQGNLVVGINF
jgi:hypothetical protein